MSAANLLARRVVLRPWPLANRIDGRVIPPGSGVDPRTFKSSAEARAWAAGIAQTHDCPVVDRT